MDEEGAWKEETPLSPPNEPWQMKSSDGRLDGSLSDVKAWRI